MARTLAIAVILLCIATTTASAQSVRALETGEIFVSTVDVAGFDFPKLVMKAVIDAPPEKVFEIVGNCDRLSERMPRVKASQTISKSALSHTCKVTIGVPFPMSDLTAVTVDRRTLGPYEWSRRWTLASNQETSYHRNVGAFVLKPFNGDPNRTLVHYEIHAIPKSAVPDFLRKTAQKKSMPGMIERIREEVAKL